MSFQGSSFLIAFVPIPSVLNSQPLGSVLCPHDASCIQPVLTICSTYDLAEMLSIFYLDLGTASYPDSFHYNSIHPATAAIISFLKSQPITPSCSNTFIGCPLQPREYHLSLQLSRPLLPFQSCLPLTFLCFGHLQTHPSIFICYFLLLNVISPLSLIKVYVTSRSISMVSMKTSSYPFLL